MKRIACAVVLATVAVLVWVATPAVSQPKVVRISVVSARALGSLPQMNIVGFWPPKSGFTMKALPTQEKHFTKRALGVLA